MWKKIIYKIYTIVKYILLYPVIAVILLLYILWLFIFVGFLDGIQRKKEGRLG